MATLFSAKPAPPQWEPTWNMVPTRDAPVVRVHPGSGERRIDLLRWGLLPHWAKVVKFGRQPINARAEGVVTAQMFRDAYAFRRCLVPVDAFYEWQSGPSGKHPWAIARTDGQCMALGGLWEGWRSGDGTVIRTFTIVTTAANDALRPVHNRMPLVLEPEDWPLWLGETEGDATGLMRPSAASFRRWRVGSGVNHVRNDGSVLLEPIASALDSAAPAPTDAARR